MKKHEQKRFHSSDFVYVFFDMKMKDFKPFMQYHNLNVHELTTVSSSSKYLTILFQFPIKYANAHVVTIVTQIKHKLFSRQK